MGAILTPAVTVFHARLNFGLFSFGPSTAILPLQTLGRDGLKILHLVLCKHFACTSRLLNKAKRVLSFGQVL